MIPVTPVTLWQSGMQCTGLAPCRWLPGQELPALAFLTARCLHALHSADLWPQKHLLPGIIPALIETAGGENHVNKHWWRGLMLYQRRTQGIVGTMGEMTNCLFRVKEGFETPLAWESKILTTGLPRKSQEYFLILDYGGRKKQIPYIVLLIWLWKIKILLFPDGIL